MANSNFTPWLGANTTTDIQNDYKTDAFAAGGPIQATTFNAALRMTSLVAAAVIEALGISGTIDQSLSDISTAVTNGIKGITITNSINSTTATNTNYLNVVMSNELQFVRPSDWSGSKSLNIGHRWSDGTSNANLISSYIFKNGNTELADIEFKTAKGNLIGNATTATTATNATNAVNATTSSKIKISNIDYTLTLSGTTLTLTVE